MNKNNAIAEFDSLKKKFETEFKQDLTVVQQPINAKGVPNINDMIRKYMMEAR